MVLGAVLRVVGRYVPRALPTVVKVAEKSKPLIQKAIEKIGASASSIPSIVARQVPKVGQKFVQRFGSGAMITTGTHMIASRFSGQPLNLRIPEIVKGAGGYAFGGKIGLAFGLPLGLAQLFKAGGKKAIGEAKPFFSGDVDVTHIPAPVLPSPQMDLPDIPQFQQPTLPEIMLPSPSQSFSPSFSISGGGGGGVDPLLLLALFAGAGAGGYALGKRRRKKKRYKKRRRHE